MATDVELRSPSDGTWQLTDLIDVTVLQSIQDTFAKVFGLPTVIIDQTGRNLTNITHRVRFCEDLTRPSPVAGSRCMTCDLHAMDRATDTNRPAIFECWNGLFDCAIPIAPKGQVLGHFLCGQILVRPPDAERFARTAEEIGVEPGDYVEALGDVRVMPLDQYESCISTMHTLGADDRRPGRGSDRQPQDAAGRPERQERCGQTRRRARGDPRSVPGQLRSARRGVDARGHRRSAPAPDPARLLPDLHGAGRDGRARSARRARSQPGGVSRLPAPQGGRRVGHGGRDRACVARSTISAATPTSSPSRASISSPRRCWSCR